MRIGFKTYKKIDIYYRGEYQWSTNSFPTVRDALIDAVHSFAVRGFTVAECLKIRAVKA